MLILGISELDCDSGAALVRDGELIGAANEERFTRVKQQTGCPVHAINWLLKKAGATIKDVDEILAVRQDVHSEYSLNLKAVDDAKFFSWPGRFTWKVANWGAWKLRWKRRRLRLSKEVNQTLLDWAREVGVDRATIERPDHHLMHAACAYYSSGYDEALAITADGQGDGKTATIYHIKNGTFNLVHSVMIPHSPGIFYSALTKAAGYTPFRHEGKITGLAARGEPDDECLAFARANLYLVDGGASFEAPYSYGSYPWLKSLVKRKGAAKLAYAYQKTLEDVLTKYCRYYVQRTGAKNVCMAGGVHANVCVNQRIHEIPEVENSFVFPHMADGGLGWGAAMYAWHRHDAKQRGASYTFEPRAIQDVYWGPSYTEEEMQRVLDADGVSYTRPDDYERAIADLLADGELVARFDGPMEFGPRALCHRSILYQATDPTVNDWLNDRLHRTEFMPFAPVTLVEDLHDSYQNVGGAEHTSEFMTVTFFCNERMAGECPAVVHVDNTARPQVVRPDRQPKMHRILSLYKERTGLSSIINTSFNMHEEPIVCSPEDAVRAARAARFRYLALGPFIAQFDVPSPSRANTREAIAT